MKIAITKPVPRSAQLFSKGPGISSRHSLPATSKAQQSFSSSLPLVLLPLYSILRWELPRLSTYLHTRSAFWCNFGISQKMFPFPEMSLSPLHSPASGFRMRHALTNSSGENEENGLRGKSCDNACRLATAWLTDNGHKCMNDERTDEGRTRRHYGCNCWRRCKN